MKKELNQILEDLKKAQYDFLMGDSTKAYNSINHIRTKIEKLIEGDLNEI